MQVRRSKKVVLSHSAEIMLKRANGLGRQTGGHEPKRQVYVYRDTR